MRKQIPGYPLTVIIDLCLAVAVGLSFLARPAEAQQNVALGRPIIDGSGSWSGGVVGEGAAYNGGQFPGIKVTDGIKTEPDNGAIGYWLGREQTLDEYFTLDLGDAYDIDRIDLYNTHNRQYNDRGTDEFVIFGALEVDASNQLIAPFPVLSGNLSDVSFEPDIPVDSYGPGDGLAAATARYLQFQALSSIYGNGNVGLNEIEVYSSSFVSNNRALNKPVIGGSGSWDGGTIGVGADFDAGQFPATAVTDGSIADADTTIWLGREGVDEEYFTLDLQEPVNIQEILLRNTTNRQYADRGTMNFRLFASDAVNASNELVNPVEILSGKLPNSAGVSPLITTVFTAENGLTPTSARYLQFQTESGTYFNGNVGLNEIEVYDEVVHEPSPLPRDNVALGKPVIDGSGSWAGGEVGVGEAFDAGGFPATRVTDGSIADKHIDGGVRSSYWLGREQTEEEYFTVDLGDVFSIDEIDLRNTHNDPYNDRGTDEFVILGALEVDGQNQLIDPFPVLAGNLTNVNSQIPITADVFTSDNGLILSDARYLQFIAVTYFGVSSGLNEIEVYGRLAGGLVGDFNGNGILDAEDIDLLTIEVSLGMNPSGYDLNDDGLVNDEDRTVWVDELKGTYFGDADLDGEFSSTDFVVVFQAGQYEDDEVANSTWATGDWDGDFEFTSADFVKAFQAGGYELGPRTAVLAAVPEPASIGLCGLAAVGLMLGLRRRLR